MNLRRFVSGSRVEKICYDRKTALKRVTSNQLVWGLVSHLKAFLAKRKIVNSVSYQCFHLRKININVVQIFLSRNLLADVS